MMKSQLGLDHFYEKCWMKTVFKADLRMSCNVSFEILLLEIKDATPCNGGSST